MMADVAVETVAYTYFLYHTTVSFPQIRNQIKVNTAVSDLKVKIASTKVVLTAQMSAVLEKWLSGEALAAEDAKQERGR